MGKGIRRISVLLMHEFEPLQWSIAKVANFNSAHLLEVMRYISRSEFRPFLSLKKEKKRTML